MTNRFDSLEERFWEAEKKLVPLYLGIFLIFFLCIFIHLCIFFFRLPRIMEENKPKKPDMVQVLCTAYNNFVWQTDSTPDINAAGLKPVIGDVAANWLPLHTKIKIHHPAFEGMVFTVRDRMNKCFSSRLDIFMSKDLKAARKFGKQILLVEVIK